jgi:hypothetical protein
MSTTKTRKRSAAKNPDTMKTEAVTPADNREPEAGGKPAKANWVRASSGSGRLCALCRLAACHEPALTAYRA